jgi:hypothetical protein
VQQSLAAQHELPRWTRIVSREIENQTTLGEELMLREASLDPEVVQLVEAAFDKSWAFVRTDPELAHNDRDELRARLVYGLTRLARNGERDMWRLANGAIGQLRRERSAA